MVQVRAFTDTDIDAIVSLFYETVHEVNKRDYLQEQLDAWASQDDKPLKLQIWGQSMRQNIAYVAEIDGKLVGFSDLTPHGLLDRLYVHKDFQRQGIASALVNRLEEAARHAGMVEIDTEASITAKPFFESRGYRVVLAQEVERRGIKLVNFKMLKPL